MSRARRARPRRHRTCCRTCRAATACLTRPTRSSSRRPSRRGRCPCAAACRQHGRRAPCVLIRSAFALSTLHFAAKLTCALRFARVTYGNTVPARESGQDVAVCPTGNGLFPRLWLSAAGAPPGYAVPNRARGRRALGRCRRLGARRRPDIDAEPAANAAGRPGAAPCARVVGRGCVCAVHCCHCFVLCVTCVPRRLQWRVCCVKVFVLRPAKLGRC